MVEEKHQEPGFEEEEIEKERKRATKPKGARQKERTGPEGPEPSQPPPLFYFHSLLLFSGRMLHRMLDFYNSLFDLTPSDKAKIYRNISTHYAKKGLHGKAQDHLKEWTRLDPANPEPHYQLGLALSSAGNFKGANRAFEKVLKLNPNHKGAIYRKSALCLKLKDYEGAVQGLEQLIKLVPDDPKAHYMLGIAFDRMDKVDEAVEAVKKAVDLDPEEIKYHQHLGFLYERREDHKQAAKCFSRVMELQREMDADE